MIYSFKKLLFITALFLAYAFAYTLFPHTNFSGTKTVVITKGHGSRLIAEHLKKEGFIESKWAFVTYVTLAKTASSLKPGSYVFTQSATIPDIIKTLAGGSQSEEIGRAHV